MAADPEKLPDDATVILHVSKGRQLPKDSAICERIDQDAFRCDDDGISVTWVEYFDGEQSERFAQAAFAMRGELKLRKSGIIAAAKVGVIREALQKIGVEVEIVRDQQPNNHAHCLIKGISPDDLSALLQLTRAFPKEWFVQCSQIPGLLDI